MTENIFITIFVMVWSGGVVSYFLIKKRLKELYPNLHRELFASSLTEHNISYSLKYQRFSLKSSEWNKIDDQKLILWLQLQRALFVIMILMMISFVIVAVNNAH